MNTTAPASPDEQRLEAEKYVGLALALTSSILIGTSFIITKKGLLDSAKNGGRVGEGFDYLKNPMWWAGTSTMILGEVANFLAYSFAPAILVTPLGAGSVFVSAILSSVFLNEDLGRDGIIGCTLCVIGSMVVILHSPEEDAIETVDDVFIHFVQPGFLMYILLVTATSIYLIFYIGPRFGKRNMLVYIAICSLVGSISVMAVKGFAVAVKLTFAGDNQLFHLSTWVFGLTVLVCAMTQINYFNKALDLFSTNRVTPIYYVFFTTATIVASIILSQGVKRSTPVSHLCTAEMPCRSPIRLTSLAFGRSR
ncbi:magnesium transporter [Entophlyctis helioformis]|nr:magnesium transporter [Entophlyctis helioformis]